MFFLTKVSIEDAKTKEYIYKLIETLLPKANFYPNETPQNKKMHFKMMEMFIYIYI